MFVMVMAILCLALTQNCIAQQIKPLKVGDLFPDMTFTKVINAPYTSIPYSKVKDKVVVLDFFATWCSSCINLFPHMDSLKRQFGDKLEIFIVSYESSKTVVPFIKKWRQTHSLRLPIITEDSILYKRFPTKTIPQEVIIKNGKIVGITYAEYLTDKSISDLLNNKYVEFPLKQDILNYDLSLSLYENNVGSPMELTLNKFLMTKYINQKGSSSYTCYNRDSTFKRYTVINQGIWFHIWNATYGIKYKNRIILNVANKQAFIRRGNAFISWLSKYGFSIEYVCPVNWSDLQRKKWLMKQLNMATSYKISIRNELVDCWILTKSISKIKQSTGSLNKVGSKKYHFGSISSLIDRLNYQLISKPLNPIIVDETDNAVIEDISLNLKNLYDPKEVSAALKSYGFYLKPGKRTLKMLVIEDK